jgi:hypothetical protein
LNAKSLGKVKTIGRFQCPVAAPTPPYVASGSLSTVPLAMDSVTDPALGVAVHNNRNTSL